MRVFALAPIHTSLLVEISCQDAHDIQHQYKPPESADTGFTTPPSGNWSPEEILLYTLMA